MFQTIFNSIVIPIRDFIYPPLCFVCDKRLQNGDDRVCMECWHGFPHFQARESVWRELNGRFIQEGVVKDFLSCYYFDKEGNLQQVIHLLKYQGMKSLGVMLGIEIGKRIAQNPLFAQSDYLIPVPLHRLKQRERGFNQSEFLCRGISDVTGIPINVSVLYRTKYTQSQTHLDLEERKQNVGNAFSVRAERIGEIEGKTIILVDDVITTGATINACARELVHAGAGTVLAAAAAVAR